MDTDEKSQDSTKEKSQSNRHVEETTHEEDDEPHRDTLSSKRRNQLKINIANAAKYPNLIRILCKCILEGDIPITKEQKKMLKTEAEIIRQIADVGEVQGQKLLKLIDQHIRIHDKTGNSIVAKLIKVATTAIKALFHIK